MALSLARTRRAGCCIAALTALAARPGFAQQAPPPAGGSSDAPPQLGAVPGGAGGVAPRPPDEPAAPTRPSTAPPRLVRFVEAEYPAEARAAGLEAAVVLQISIDAQGHVTEATVAQGAGHGFDEAAVAAARQFEFVPAQRDGQPAPAQIRYRYRFTLRSAAAPQPGGAGSTPAARAPHAIVRGVVRDAQNRAVAGATVSLRFAPPPAGASSGGAAEVGQPALTQTTDTAGGFRFELADVGSAQVNVTARGFRDFRAEEQVADRDDLQVIYRLTPAAAPATPGAARPGATARAPDEEPGITVRGVRPPREVTRTTIDRREIERIPGTGGDALRAIQNLPGLSRAPFLSGLLLVRGAAPQDTVVFVDGTELPLLYHFGGLASTIPTPMLDRIDFYPGNYSARFGRAMGGIVDVGLRSPRRRGFGGLVNINAIDASIFVEGAITPTLSFAVAARRSYVDLILNAILTNVEGVNLTAAPVYYDYQGILEWRPLPAHRFRLALLGTDDTLSILFRRPSDSAPTLAGGISLATRYHIAQVSWQHDIAPGTQQRLMLSTGWTNLALSALDRFRLDLGTFPFNARYEFSHTINRFARFHLGFDVQFGQTSVQLAAIRPPDMGQSFADSPPIATTTSGWYTRPGMYVEAELTPVRGLRVVPGLRVDYFHEIRAAILQPRVSARWEFVRDWAIRGGVGLFAQPPAFQESSAAPNSFFPGQTLGNPALLPQRAMHYSLGGEHNFSRWISLSIEGFYKTLDDLVVSTPNNLARVQPPPPPYTNLGIGRIYGAEVLLRHRASERFFGWIAYTLLRSERRDAPDQAWRVYDFDQTHILTMVGSLRLPYGFEVGARFRYVTGSPSTPNVGGTYNADSFTYTAVPGERNSTRNRDFHQLDLRIDKTFRWRWGSLGLFLEVLNVYNNANQEGTQYNYNYTQSQPITGLPIFPNLGIRGEL